MVPGTTEEETEEEPSVLEQVRTSEEAKRQKTSSLVAGLLVVAHQTVGEVFNAC